MLAGTMSNCFHSIAAVNEDVIGTDVHPDYFSQLRSTCWEFIVFC